jgi:hypothetical protein
MILLLSDPPRGTQEKAFIELSITTDQAASTALLHTEVDESQNESNHHTKAPSTSNVSSTMKYTEVINTEKLCELLTTSSVVIILIQGIIGCLPWGMMVSDWCIGV